MLQVLSVGLHCRLSLRFQFDSMERIAAARFTISRSRSDGVISFALSILNWTVLSEIEKSVTGNHPSSVLIRPAPLSYNSISIPSAPSVNCITPDQAIDG